jgi:hypothetical protein
MWKLQAADAAKLPRKSGALIRSFPQTIHTPETITTGFRLTPQIEENNLGR